MARAVEMEVGPPLENPAYNQSQLELYRYPSCTGGGSVTYTLICADSHGNQGSGTALVSVASGSGGGGSTCCPAGLHFGWSLGNNASDWSCLGDYADKNPIGGCGGPTYNVISCNNGVYVDNKVCSLDGGLPSNLCAGSSSNTCSSGNCPAQNPTWMTNCSGSLAVGSVGDVVSVSNTVTGYTGQETATCQQNGVWAYSNQSCTAGSCPDGQYWNGTTCLSGCAWYGSGVSMFGYHCKTGTLSKFGTVCPQLTDKCGPLPGGGMWCTVQLDECVFSTTGNGPGWSDIGCVGGAGCSGPSIINPPVCSGNCRP